MGCAIVTGSGWAPVSTFRSTKEKAKAAYVGRSRPCSRSRGTVAIADPPCTRRSAPPSASTMRSEIFLFVVVAACAPEVDRLEDWSCPPEGTALTYESFGEPFFDEWCAPCHAERPNGIGFDDVDEIRER